MVDKVLSKIKWLNLKISEDGTVIHNEILKLFIFNMQQGWT